MSNSSHEVSLEAVQPPLHWDKGGALRVGKSRVSLDLVVDHYEQGLTPEDMVRAYDTLILADVYAVIAYYLQHRDAVTSYLSQRAESAAALQAGIESAHPPVSREGLLKRRNAEMADASTGQ